MADRESKLSESIDEIKSDITEIKVTLAKNTESLEHHVRRTDTLQDMVTPVYEAFMAQKAIKEYKEEQRKDLMYKLKLPVSIIAALGAIGSAIAWFMGK